MGSIRTQRKYSREFKLQVVRQLTSGEKSRGQVLREYQLSGSVLDRWRREVQDRGEEQAFHVQEPTEVERLQARIADLERILGQLYAENAVLKKTLERPL